MRKKTTFIVCVVLFIFSYFDVFCQNLTLEIFPKDDNNIPVFKAIPYLKTHKYLESIYSEIENFTKTLQHYGFLAPSYRVIKKNDSLYNSIITTNKRVDSIYLSFKGKFDFSDFVYSRYEKGVQIPFYELKPTLERLTSYFENNGFSFVEVQLTDIKLDKNQLYASVWVDAQRRRNIDKVVLKGYSLFPKKFLKHHFRLSPETIFNKNKLAAISRDIRSLDFVEEIKPSEVLFTKDSTHVYLYLSKKKANQFDGLIGFSNDNSNRIKFNGYIDIVLKNSFNKGTTITLYWSNNGNKQENFRFKTKIPYLLNSPVSSEIKFEIYKQDSSFINISTWFLADYRLNFQNKIGASLILERSNSLLKIPSSSIESYSSNFYGVYYNYLSLKQNLKINTNINFGARKTESKLEKQYLLGFEISYLGRINNRSSLFLKNKTQTLISNTLFFNELFKLGGANSIRGFNEQSIFASTYNYSNTEYRFSTDLESYLYSFFDVAFTENKTDDTKNRFYSFGLGYEYYTKFGVVNISYGIGKINKDPFDLNTGIFNIKLVSSF